MWWLQVSPTCSQSLWKLPAVPSKVHSAQHIAAPVHSLLWSAPLEDLLLTTVFFLIHQLGPLENNIILLSILATTLVKGGKHNLETALLMWIHKLLDIKEGLSGVCIRGQIWGPSGWCGIWERLIWGLRRGIGIHGGWCHAVAIYCMATTQKMCSADDDMGRHLSCLKGKKAVTPILLVYQTLKYMAALQYLSWDSHACRIQSYRQ